MKDQFTKILFLSMLLITIWGSAQVNDINGQKYKTKVIGSRTWMAENLNVDRFKNGDIIPEAKTDEEWRLAGENKQPAWCYYDGNIKKGKKYGKLYNWYAVSDPRGLAPTGYHIPTKDEINSNAFLYCHGGYRDVDGFYERLGDSGYWWSSSTYDGSYKAWFHRDPMWTGEKYKDMATGLSVRCVRNGVKQ
jgi:hypothetical protein